MPTLQVENVAKRFGGLVALDGVSLEARPGVITSIIGQNGAGKTTLINAIAQLPPPDRGRILVGDDELTGIAPARVARWIGRSFQQLRIFTRLSVLDNVLLAFQGNQGEAVWRLVSAPFSVRRQRAAHVARAHAILARLEIDHLADQDAGKLSYGQQKMVSIARVLATDAPVLMFDEPTSGLSREFIERILALMSEVRSVRKTVILVEHDMDVVFEISDWIVVLDHGRLFAQGRPSEIRSNMAVRDIYFGSQAD